MVRDRRGSSEEGEKEQRAKEARVAEGGARARERARATSGAPAPVMRAATGTGASDHFARVSCLSDGFSKRPKHPQINPKSLNDHFPRASCGSDGCSTRPKHPEMNPKTGSLHESVLRFRRLLQAPGTPANAPHNDDFPTASCGSDGSSKRPKSRYQCCEF